MNLYTIQNEYEIRLIELKLILDLHTYARYFMRMCYNCVTIED